MAPKWVTGLVALVVSAMWIASLLVGFFQESYAALTLTTPVMLILAGYAFGVKIISRQHDD